MRSGIHGTFATLLLMIPVLSIPALAIFGIPQFAPVVASPLDEGPSRDRERRVGQSERPAPDGFLSDLDDHPADQDEFSRSRDDMRPVGRIGDSVSITGGGHNAPAWNSAESDLKRPSDPSAGTDSWADDLGNEGRRNAGVANTSTDRNGFDTRFTAAPVDAPRAVKPTMGREQRGNLVPVASTAPADRTAPRAYQREREASSSPTVPVRQASHVREPLTWQTAVQRLNDLEIRNFRLERGHRDNQFMFICSYTPSDSPRVSFRFEAEADEPMKAVEKVLEQIAEWQERR